MTRFPSHHALAEMSGENRHSTLDASARNLRDLIAGLENGSVFLTNGRTVAQELRNTRRCLARVYAAADAFGHYVGQPDRESA